MKLLFDENLSPKPPEILSSQFPGSLHVRDCGLKGFPDEAIWDYARNHDFTIISKDSDFYQRSVLYGHPPKLVWLRIGNCTRAEIVTLVNNSQKKYVDLLQTQLNQFWHSVKLFHKAACTNIWLTHLKFYA